MRKKMPIFYSALMLTAVNLMLRFVSTSFQVYVSGRIGAAGVGLLQLVISVGSLAMTAGIAGIRTATMYLTAEELGRKRPGHVIWVLSGCFGYSILFSGLVSMGLYRFAPFLAEKWIGNVDTVAAVRLFACFLPVSCLCGVMTGYFTAANRIGTLAVIEIAEQFFSMVCSVTALNLWAGTDPSRACQCMILGSGLGACLTLICLVALRLREPSEPCPKIPVCRSIAETALPLALADDLKSGITTAENLMVPKRLAQYGGCLDPLADFGIVCGMVFPVLMFPAAIVYGLAELLIPELARCSAAGSERRIKYLTGRSLRVVLLYGCLFCGLMFLNADWLCGKLYAEPNVAKHLRLYTLLIPMLYCDAITDAMTKGLGQQKICVRNNIITSIMDIVGLFLLLPYLGMTGYFISFLISHLANFLLSIRLLFQVTGRRVSMKMPMLCLLSTAAAVGLAALLEGLARSAAFLIILGCLLALFGVISKEDARWIKGLIRG